MWAQFVWQKVLLKKDVCDGERNQVENLNRQKSSSLGRFSKYCPSF